MHQSPETIFINGSVLTVDQRDRECEAVAVCGNRISFVGTTADARRRIGPEDTIIDLSDRTLLPGFNDAHCHLGYAGTVQLQAYVGYPEVRSVDDIKKVLAQWAAKTPKGQWIVGRGWDETKYPDRRIPTRWDLDEVAPDHLVFLTRTCGHMSVVNSRLLAAEGIDRHTPDPHGGVIERNARGEPTGLLLEHAHIPLRTKTAASVDLLDQGMSIMNRQFMSLGITSAADMSGRDRNEIQLMQKKLSRGEIQIRIYFAARNSGQINFGTNYIKTGLITGYGSPWLRLGCFKAQMDGSGSGGSGAMWTPYPGRDPYTGILHMTQEELDALVLEGHRAEYQVCVHAVGTRAIEMTLNSYERALREIPKEDHRFRIEHCTFVEDRLADRIRDLGVIPIIGPAFLYWVGDGYIQKYYPEWLDWAVAARRLLDRGIPVAFHSDLPVVPCNPLPAIYSAVTRKTESGQEIGPRQKVTVKEAIRAYTYAGAYASFEENLKGSIEAGKWADLVVLSSNILRVAPEEIKNLHVDLTMVDGQMRFPPP